MGKLITHRGAPHRGSKEGAWALDRPGRTGAADRFMRSPIRRRSRPRRNQKIGPTSLGRGAAETPFATNNGSGGVRDQLKKTATRYIRRAEPGIMINDCVHNWRIRTTSKHDNPGDGDVMIARLGPACNAVPDSWGSGIRHFAWRATTRQATTPPEVRGEPCSYYSTNY